MPTVLYNIGNTPLVQINKVHKTHGIECDIRKCRSLIVRKNTVSLYLLVLKNNVLFLNRSILYFQLQNVNFLMREEV